MPEPHWHYEEPADVAFREADPYVAPTVEYTLPTYKEYIPTFDTNRVDVPYEPYNYDHGELFTPYNFFMDAVEYGEKDGFNYGKFYHPESDPVHGYDMTPDPVKNSHKHDDSDGDYWSEWTESSESSSAETTEEVKVYVSADFDDVGVHADGVCYTACADIRAERDALAAELYLMKVKYEGYSGPYYFPAYH